MGNSRNNILDANNLPKEVPLNSKAADHRGERNGLITALYPIGANWGNDKNKSIWWVCKCDCGRYTRVRSQHIKRTFSCGCSRRTNELVGKRFGKLTVIERAGTDNWRNAVWKCACDCGSITFATGTSLRNNNVISCGCVKSYGEYTVQKTLKELDVSYIREYSFPDLKDRSYLRFDFALLDKNDKVIGLIEFQGEQHYDKNNRFYSSNLEKHDIMKKEYCENNNIPLLYLTKKDDIEKEILKFLLINKLR